MELAYYHSLVCLLASVLVSKMFIKIEEGIYENIILFYILLVTNGINF
jgi:hypothetical protein